MNESFICNGQVIELEMRVVINKSLSVSFGTIFFLLRLFVV